MKKKLFLIRLIITLTILSILIYKIGIKTILKTLTNTNALVFFVALPVYLIVMWIGAFNIYLFINKINNNIKLKEITKYSFISWSLGTYLPSKTGEFSLALFLKKKKISIGKTTAAILIDILITLFVLGILGLLGIIKLIKPEPANLLILFFIFIITILISYVIIISKKIKYIIKKYILKKYSKIFNGFSHMIKLILKDKKIIVINIILTLAKFIISSVITLSIFLALNTYVSLFNVLLITSLTVLISTIPITINGFGLREGSAVYFYSLINIKPDIVIGTYIIHTIIQYFISITILLIFSKDLIEIKKITKKVLNKN